MPTWLRRIARDDSGQDVVEYALLISVGVLFAIAAWNSLRDAIARNYTGTTSGVHWDPLPPSGS
jgi:Flp pilus assembly pilin Flp